MKDINPFSLEPCAGCGRRNEPTAIDMKRTVMEWAGDNSKQSIANMNRQDWITLYKKILDMEAGDAKTNT